jgi:hypothetical protein
MKQILYFKKLDKMLTKLKEIRVNAESRGWKGGVDIQTILARYEYDNYLELIGRVEGMRLGRRYTLRESVKERTK